MQPTYPTTIGQGPDLVLVHGWGMNAEVWAPLLDRLAARRRVTRIELPGHGDAPVAGADWSAWVAQAVHSAPAQADWVGWSLGAQLALSVAAAAPERVRRLVAVTGTPRFVAAADWPVGMPAETFAEFERQLGVDHRATLERFLALQFLGDPAGRPAAKALRRAILGRPLPTPATLAAGLAHLRGLDLRPELARLDCSSLWLFGERDTLVRPATLEGVRSLNAGVRVEVLPGAAHAPFLTMPERFLDRVDAFLGQG